MIVGLSSSTIAKATAVITTPITIANVLNMSFQNVPIKAGNDDKLEDESNGRDSINNDRGLIINMIAHSLNLFT
jgi:hypothetical protein